MTQEEIIKELTIIVSESIKAGVEAEREQSRAEVERLREIGNATFMAMCAFRDSNDEEAFQDAIDALGVALENKP
jgi:hypothetical protein